MPSCDVVIVGAGAIGVATAWRCAQRGLSVTVVDPDPRRGAWYTAAGMLAPTTELHFTETPLLELNLDSLARFPGFVAELEAETGREVDYRPSGAIAVAWDGADLAALHDLQLFAQGLDVDARLLTGAELRQLEPSLAAGLPGGLLAPGDHQVDPRLLHAALAAAGTARGVRFVAATAAVDVDGDRLRGVTLSDGTALSAGTVVLAAGSWSWQVEGVPRDALAPVRPVKGQTLRLTAPRDLQLRHIVRASVRGSAVYVVPRPDGRLVVGASVEEAGFDLRPRAGAVYELLRDAQSIVPELSEAVFDEVCTGLRPGSPDNAPIVGETGIPGLLHATGHYRNGILLSPLTADGIAGLIVDGTLPDALATSTAGRFAARPADAEVDTDIEAGP
jgi:glycine oxidase